MNTVKIKGVISNYQQRTTPNGQHGRFDLGASDNYTNHKGEDVQVTTWYNVVTESAQVINHVSQLEPRSEAIISGRLSQREYTDKDGSKRLIVEIIADSVIPANIEALEHLSHYIADDDIADAYSRLLAAEPQDMADDHVSMWEPLTFRYTVAELLSMCGVSSFDLQEN